MGQSLQHQVTPHTPKHKSLAKTVPSLTLEAILWTTFFYLVCYFFLPPPPGANLVSLFALLGLLLAAGRRKLWPGNSKDETAETTPDTAAGRHSHTKPAHPPATAPQQPGSLPFVHAQAAPPVSEHVELHVDSAITPTEAAPHATPVAHHSHSPSAPRSSGLSNTPKAPQ